METSDKRGNDTKRQHYVNRSFLAAWTHNGTKGGALWVLDKSNGSSGTRTTKNIAFAWDLYTLERDPASATVDPLGVEDDFCRLENAAMPIITEVVRSKRLPVNDPYVTLMLFIAALHVRVPKTLAWSDDVTKQIVSHAQAVAASNPRMSAENVAKLRAELSAMAVGSNADLCVNQNHRMGTMLHLADALALVLAERTWTILDASASNEQFVCTDAPVTLTFTGPGSPHYGRGFDAPDSEVLVPLSPNVAMIGTWGTGGPPWALKPFHVALYNSRLVGGAERYVFSRGDFRCLHQSGAIHSRQEVIRTYQDAATQRGSGDITSKTIG